MKLKQIHIENFKSIRQLDIAFHSDVNIIIGKNNVGKSNILDCMPFVSTLVMSDSQTVESNFVEDNLGAIANVVYAKKLPSEIAVKMNFELYPQDIEDLKSSHEKWNELFSGIATDTTSTSLEYTIKISALQLPQQRIFAELKSEDVVLTVDKKRIPIANGLRVLEGRDGREGYYVYQHANFDKIGSTNANELYETFERARGRYETRTLLQHVRLTSGLDHWWDYPLLMVYNFIRNVRKLNATRETSGSGTVQGQIRLMPNGSNLVQILNTLSSTDRDTFGKILDGVRRVVGGELTELKAPLSLGQSTAYVATVESNFPGKEFTWNSVPTGIKEILYVLTALYTTPRGGFIAIEEPEIHLHWDALVKLTEIIKEVAKNEDKQIVLATHSPIIVDNSPLEKIFVIVREKGETKYVPLESFSTVGEALDAAGIPYSWLLLSKQPRYILIVEGRDDNKVWRQFLKRKNIEVDNSQVIIINGMRTEGGGTDEAILTAKLLLRIKSPAEWKLILDSDGHPEALSDRLQGIPANRIHILSKKELESYLIDEGAITKLTGKTSDEVKKAIEDSKREGKEQLDDIFVKLGLTKPVASIKELLALQLDTLDNELDKILLDIGSNIPRTERQQDPTPTTQQ